MPLTDKQKEQKKKYYQEHKQEIQEKNKKYHEEHKQKILEKKKEYNEVHKKEKQEYDKKYKKIYATTENGKKYNKINMWKYKGVISDDYNELYDKYINATECELCKTPIIEGRGLIGKKCLDHNHETGEFRNILCGHCNINIMRFK